MVYLAKGSFWSWLGAGAQVVTGIVLAIAFGNLISPDAYGNYKYILSVSSLLGAFTLNGLKKSVMRSVAQGYDGSLKQAVKAMISWSGLITVLAGGVSAYYFLQGNALLGSGILFIAIFQPIIKTTDLYDAQLYGKKLFRVQGAYLTVQEIFQTIFLVGAMLITSNAAALIAVLFVTNTAFKSTYLYRTFQYYTGDNKKTKGRTVTFGKHLSVMGILKSIAGQLDKVLIFQLLGAAPTAIYSFATMPAQRAKRFLGSLQNVVLPKLSEKNLKTLQKTLTRKALLAFIVSGLITIAVILALPLAFNLLLPAYTDSIVFAQWASLMIFLIPETLYSEALNAHAQTKSLYIISIATSLTKIILFAILIPLLGVWGAVLAFVFQYFLRTVLEIYFFYTAEPISENKER